MWVNQRIALYKSYLLLLLFTIIIIIIMFSQCLAHNVTSTERPCLADMFAGKNHMAVTATENVESLTPSGIKINVGMDQSSGSI